MTWPTGPPPMPPAGWYADPERDLTWRWWDGTTWTELRSPMWTPPVRDPTSFGAWFERSFACVKVAVRRVGLLVAGAWLGLALAGVALVTAAYTSGRGRELRQLFDDASTTEGPVGQSFTFEWSDAEAERAWELFQGILWSVLPWAVLLALVYVVVSAWTYALVGQVASAAIDDTDGGAGAGERSVERVGAIARRALARTPAVIAASLLFGLILTGALLAPAIPVILVVIAGGSGAAIGLTVFFCVCAGLVLVVWLWGRLALSVVIAAIGGHGVGVRRSWELTHGQFWYVVGRLVMAGLVTGAVSSVASFFANTLSLLGVIVGLGVFLVLSGVLSAVTTIVSVCAHVVIVDQARQLHEPPVTP